MTDTKKKKLRVCLDLRRWGNRGRAKHQRKLGSKVKQNKQGGKSEVVVAVIQRGRTPTTIG